MPKDHGIKADYYLYGIELGILSFEQAITWADQVIEFEAEPTGEIIDLALSRPRGRNGVMEALKEIEGKRQPQVAGAMLLNDLSSRLEQGENIKGVASKALNVAWATQLPEEVRWEFDHIDDEISLVEQGIYGDLAHCETELRNSLNKYRHNAKT
ncbi:hypothetical protein KFE80_00340 [bacterium SCSIO 12696]|nr:hypothetical protein KFE80_00340 [bacterium SCSIO 12696]